MQKLILRNFQSPGDIVMLTAAVRDLHLTWMQDNVGCRIHGGEFADELTSWRRFGGSVGWAFGPPRAG